MNKFQLFMSGTNLVLGIAVLGEFGHNADLRYLMVGAAACFCSGSGFSGVLHRYFQ